MTTRQFKISSVPSPESGSGIIVFDGVEIFNGAFPNVSETDVLIAGSVDITNPVDGSDIIKSVSITVTSGVNVYVGLFEWNYSVIQNPAFTPEQRAAYNNPTTTTEQRLAIFEAVANPSFSSADLDIFASTDPADNPIKYELLYNHKCFMQIQDEATYSFGGDTSYCNRTNVLLNGVTPPNADTNYPIAMTAGDVLTFDTIIFASNIGQQPPEEFTL